MAMHQKHSEALKSKMEALQAQQKQSELERAEESDGQQRQLGALQASRWLALTATLQIPSCECLCPPLNVLLLQQVLQGAILRASAQS